MAKKKFSKRTNKFINLYSEGGNTTGTVTSQIGGAAGSVLSFLPNINDSGSTGLDSSIETAIYGDSRADPIVRMINDLSGKSTKSVIDALNREGRAGFDSTNNNTLLSDWNNTSIRNTYNTDKNLIGKTLGAFVGGAPWLDFKNDGVQFDSDNLIASAQGAMHGSQFGPWGALAGGILGGVTNLVSRMGRNSRINKINQAIENSNNQKLGLFDNTTSNLNKQTVYDTLANFSAYGGPIYNFAKGGKIHIKEANKGKFTDYCGGKVTSECIARGKRSSDPAVRKRATFADNARKWHHALCGYLYDEAGNLYVSVPNIGQHGGNFSNGVTIIGNGGTHEENPMEGVPMGIAPDGTPNLVEQGEVKFNNYVFSNRLFATGGLLAAYNLPTTYADHSFADIAERLSKESSERPNDPISKRGLMSAMTRLQQAQEQMRIKENKDNNKYAHGGKIGRKYDGLGNMSNTLQFYTPEEKWLRTAQEQGIVPTYEFSAFKKPYSMMTPEERKSSFNFEVPSLVDTRTQEEKWFDRNIKPYQFNPSTNTSSSNDINRNTTQNSGPTWLRYAPAVGAGLGVLTDAIGLTNKPDYSNANLIGKVADNLTNIEYSPIGNYLTYRPLDRNYYINKLNSQAGATRRAIVNQSGGNRATAMAGLLAADYNAQNALGNLARQAEEYNLNQRNAVETFNRGTNQLNSEMALRTAIANKENDKIRLQARMAQANLRDQADARSSAGRTANLTNLFDSLGDIGREEYARNMIQTNPALYYSIDRNGNITYKNGYDNLSEAEKKVVRDAANKDKNRKKTKGGYLTIRGGK